MKTDYISRDTLRQYVQEYRTGNGVEYAVPLKAINQARGMDAVSRAAYEQAVWERELAMKQLADCGLSLEGKKNED